MSEINHEHDRWTDRLSDFLDGGLDPEAREGVESHLAGCGRCRRVLEELREVRTRARSLGPVEPERDLWPGIIATIGAPPAVEEQTRVISLLTAREGRDERDGLVEEQTRPPAPRRFSLTMRQLAAASIVLVAASSLLTWSVGAMGADVADGAETTSPDATGFVQPAATEQEPPAELASELAALERLLGEARAALDPNTVRVLERNLGIVEQAILDSQRALAQDPENDFLADHLRRVYERKLEYLRDAVRVAERVS